MAAPSDAFQIARLGQDFFQESEFPAFSKYDPDRFLETQTAGIRDRDIIAVLAFSGQQLVGFVEFNLSRQYTKEPIALLFLMYVVPGHRKGMVGRFLIDAACNLAKAEGATVFYAGAMANIPVQDRKMVNMLKKMGFELLAGWGRRIL